MADGQVKDEKMGTEQPDRMFSDIFGSDLEDSDEEADLKSREVQDRSPGVADRESDEVGVKRQREEFDKELEEEEKEQEREEDEEEVDGEIQRGKGRSSYRRDEEFGDGEEEYEEGAREAGDLLRKKKERLKEREREARKEKLRLKKKRKERLEKQKKRRREEDRKLAKEEEGLVDGAEGGYEDPDDGFIDDTGAEPLREDEDDVVRTEGGLGIGSDIEARSDEEAGPKSYFQQQMDTLRRARGRKKQDMDNGKIEEECMNFIEGMMHARDKDLVAYENNKPALSKLKMLPEVERMLAKIDYRDTLLDNLLLPVIKAWLDPMPDGALPNISIRKKLLEHLDTFPVDQDWVQRLRSSQGLGRVVHFLSTRDDDDLNRRLAKKLIRKWSRPIYTTNADFRSLKEDYARNVAPRAYSSGTRSLARVNEQKLKRIGGPKHMARVPARVEFNFEKMPASQVLSPETRLEKKESRRAKKLEAAVRGMRAAKRRPQRAIKVSLQSSDIGM